jgi:hypothetical protein
LKQVASKYKLPGQDGIIRAGIQIISNKEVFGLMSRMCAPKDLESMQYELYQSCFPTKTSADYTDNENSVKHITEYKSDLLTYLDRFEDKLKLLSYTDKARKFIPSTLFKKGGSMGNTGLADFFIYGLPKPDFGMRIWASVEEEERLKCKDWATFVKLFQQAIDEIE